MATDPSRLLGGQNVLRGERKALVVPIADQLLGHSDGLGHSALVAVESGKRSVEAGIAHTAVLQNCCYEKQQESCSGGATSFFVDFVGMDEITPAAVKRLREARGWSQGRLADEARAIARADGHRGALTQQSVAKYEGGRTKRVPEWLRYVTQALTIGGQQIRSEVQPLNIADVHREKFGDKELPLIPLLGTAMAGEWSGPEQHVELTELDLSEVLGHVTRPQSLKDDGKAYAVTIVGDSMWPRFRPGRRVIVSPRASISIGDDVIVQLLGHDDGSGDRRVHQVLIKELARRSASHIELRQFNPDVTFKVATREVAAMHKVVGEIF